MKSQSKLILLGFVLTVASLSLFSWSSFAGDKLAKVYVYAKANEEYVARRATSEGLLPETYHIMEGQFYGGNVSDASLITPDFQTLAETLKMELLKQEYYPAREFKQGDLLIVVHWGAVNAPEDLAEDFGEEAAAGLGVSDVFDESSALNQRRIDERVLGFERAFDDGGLTLREEQMLLSQYYKERYFFILQAYDWQKKLQTGENEALWTTKFSLESTGTNFVDSFPALMRGARGFYGVDLQGIATQKTNFGEGEVTMGKLEVIDSAEAVKDIE